MTYKSQYFLQQQTFSKLDKLIIYQEELFFKLFMKISSGSLQECLNTKLLLELQIFKATRIRIWFVAISVLAKIL